MIRIYEWHVCDEGVIIAKKLKKIIGDVLKLPRKI